MDDKRKNLDTLARGYEEIDDLRETGAEEAPCAPGSIEQQLDMCERGPLRGDAILHEFHGDARTPELAEIGSERSFDMDMATHSREGADMSGDDHSSGLQGGEPELKHQPHIASGLPGEATEDEEDEVTELARRRAA